MCYLGPPRFVIGYDGTERRKVTVNISDWQAADFGAHGFEEHRAHLRSVAYRMLGSLTEAEDAVQESWLRLSRADTGDVRDLRAWLTTVVSRVCLDMLRSRTSRREDSLDADVHLPDPIVTRVGDDPAEHAVLANSVWHRAARRARHAVTRRAARVRAARRLRRPVRADRPDP